MKMRIVKPLLNELNRSEIKYITSTYTYIQTYTYIYIRKKKSCSKIEAVPHIRTAL